MGKPQKISFAKGLLFLLFPPTCVGCGELMPWREGQDEVFCPVCREAWREGFLPASETVVRREDGLMLVSLVKYRSGKTDGIPEKLIYRMKHKNERRVFSYVAKALAPVLEDAISRVELRPEDLIITYPPRRPAAVRKEGFDQAEQLALTLSRETGWPTDTLLLRTGKRKKAQKTLDAVEREVNAKDAYRIDAEEGALTNTTVILVDDVHTTGATLSACADLLLAAGTEAVLLVTVARTVQSATHLPTEA